MSRHLPEIKAWIRRRRLNRAGRVYGSRANAAGLRSLPGSDHSHLLRTPRGF